MNEVVNAVLALDTDTSVRAIIITGRGKAFAAGADIKEMASLDEKQVETLPACTTQLWKSGNISHGLWGLMHQLTGFVAHNCSHWVTWDHCNSSGPGLSDI